MKNKGFKIAATVLTLVICLITHPFISVSAKEKGTVSPILMGKYKNSVNNTGNGNYNNFCQVTYNYTVDEPSYTIGLSVGATVESEFSLVYCMDINIQLNQVVESAQVNLTFTSPLGSSPYYELPFIAENCRVTSVSDRIIYLQVRNSDTANLKIIYSLEMVDNMYGYDYIAPVNPLQSPLSPEWISNGNAYVDITNVSLLSVTLPTNTIENTASNILTSVDGIEGLLNTIVSNTSYISNISSNIPLMLNVLNSINAQLDNIDNKIDTITWHTISTSYYGYTTDLTNLDTSGGYHDAGYYKLNGFNFTTNYINGIYKLYIPLGGVEYEFDDFVFYQYRNNELHEITFDSYLWYGSRYGATLYFVINENATLYPLGTDPVFIYCNKRIYYYSSNAWLLQDIQPTDIEYWTIYAAIKNNMLYSDLHSNFLQVIELLQDFNVTVTNSDVTNVVTSYNTNINQVYNIENNFNYQLNSLINRERSYDAVNTMFIQYSETGHNLRNILTYIYTSPLIHEVLLITIFGIIILAILG